MNVEDLNGMMEIPIKINRHVYRMCETLAKKYKVGVNDIVVNAVASYIDTMHHLLMMTGQLPKYKPAQHSNGKEIVANKKEYREDTKESENLIVINKF
ncbi:hypothetical protein FACS1894152_6140 [Bacilli bacterium]|nr:hypothetical protein FACS1894152_6140 [Bacilli bacterium]